MRTCMAVFVASVVGLYRPPHLYRPAALPTRLPVITMALPPGGADLQGGRDEPRNADVAALKRLFYRTANEAAVPEEASAALRLGLHIDLPTCRWGTEPFLPHQQLLLNIFQPEYTHLFEALVATPRPWLYMHLHRAAETISTTRSLRCPASARQTRAPLPPLLQAPLRSMAH